MTSDLTNVLLSYIHEYELHCYYYNCKGMDYDQMLKQAAIQFGALHFITVIRIIKYNTSFRLIKKSVKMSDQIGCVLKLKHEVPPPAPTDSPK